MGPYIINDWRAILFTEDNQMTGFRTTLKANNNYTGCMNNKFFEAN
jgi:hypothetical protein